MRQHRDVLIVGGGVIGLSTAWYLTGEGVTVTVLDLGELGRQASWAGAGIIPPASAAHAATPFDQLRAHSAALYPQLSTQLRERTGIDNGYVVCGGIELPADDEPDALPTEEWHGEGIAFERLELAALQRRVPGLAAQIDHGVWLPDMAQVRNPWHLGALKAGCLLAGVELLSGWPVRRLIRSGERIRAVEGEHGQMSADRVLIAAGAWSDGLLGEVGWAPGIRPIRGQIALLATGVEGVRPILMQGKRYLVPRTDGRLLVGSTEEDVGFDARPTAGGVAGLLALAVRLVPSLAAATLERSWAGLRPGSRDGLPYLGRVPGWDNLYVAAGHFRAGLQLSPATGLVMAQCLLDRPTLVPLDVFRLDRP